MAEVAKYKLKATGQQVDEAVAKRTQVLDSAPTSETVGVVGGMAVIGNSLYVCTAVTEVEGEPTTYTWLKVKGIVDIVQTNGILKGDGNGNAVQAIEGTDYQGALTNTQLENIDKLNNKTIVNTLGSDNTTIPTSKAVRDGVSGDMKKAVYDTDDDGKVDDAEHADNADLATTATSATNATNADKVGGQRVLSGKVSIANSKAVINFSPAFSSAPTVVATVATTGTNGYPCHVYSVSGSSATIYPRQIGSSGGASALNAGTVHWIAIGS